jgi:hypothetical protein
MSQADDKIPPRRAPRRRVVLLVLAAGIVGLSATYLLRRQPAKSPDAIQAAELRRLAKGLRGALRDGSGPLPQSLPAGTADTQLVYRPIAAGGEVIAFDAMGTRAVAWFSTPATPGRRVVMLNDLEVYLLPDARIDLNAQQVRLDDGLDRARSNSVTDEEPALVEESATTTEP